MPPRRSSLTLDGASLSPEAVDQVARRQLRVRLDRRVPPRLAASRKVVERAVRSGATVYGVNTGFGHLASVRIEPAALARLQVNLIRSHAAGVGPLAPAPVVRALLLCRANVLARGHSGVRLIVLRQLLALLEHDILPCVPLIGSVGASGDLAPLAHVALAAIGEGEVSFRGRVMPAATALARVKLAPLELQPKEGLALVNGTQLAAAIGALQLVRAEQLMRHADLIAALSIEGLKGTWRACDPRIHEARAHAGQRAAATNMRRLLQGSGIMNSHADCGRVQDAYSLRCAPQVHGAMRDAQAELRRVLTIELNASTDNPMVFTREGEIISGGNFHAAPLAAALDYAALTSCSLASISERRVDRLVNPLVSGLPAFLAQDPGLESGLMMAQVTAAALVSECKTLAHPGSIDSIPTSANQEDHVSMAPWCARKYVQILDRLERVLAIELLAALRAIRFHRPLRSSAALEAAIAVVARVAPIPREEFVPGPLIERLAQLIAEGTLLAAAKDGGVALL